MKVGLISDTHGQAGRLRDALRALGERGAEVIVHCGDLGSAACLRALGDAPVPARAVLGNVDGPQAGEFAATAAACGVALAADVTTIPLGDGRYQIGRAHV